jgi:hypothetical protein
MIWLAMMMPIPTDGDPYFDKTPDVQMVCTVGNVSFILDKYLVPNAPYKEYWVGIYKERNVILVHYAKSPYPLWEWSQTFFGGWYQRPLPTPPKVDTWYVLLSSTGKLSNESFSTERGIMYAKPGKYPVVVDVSADWGPNTIFSFSPRK